MECPPQGTGTEHVGDRTVVVDRTHHSDVMVGEEVEDQIHGAVAPPGTSRQDDLQERVVVEVECFAGSRFAVRRAQRCPTCPA